MYYGVLLFLNLGTPEIMLIVFVALLLFGGKKLPELARGLGKGIREFKDASDGVKREIHRNINTLTAEEELRRDEAAAQRPSTQQPEEGVTSVETEQTIKP
ncbi:Sec-independent protein translocase protein TatAd [Pedobacter glucosidilyticus]|uniref:Sec-independent protein translocase protein TatA n=1 Tax=Pedobacter aquae TaxID=2605747 RepID=A0A5C0VI55_9SPHI|nr:MULTISPECIES: twin-arginine translocase TatA/TatE family subunit [Pedobacter]KHJ39155.1 Sec-independent protein translocase protein TatAd [Pedobacter glucosidilyticus]QEK52176.1 twin-arginine translocase TatA/TatE family subunit [Pedobacter aquae]